MSSKSDFLIKDGVLKRYLGEEEKVIIPDGVKKIGYRAFCPKNNDEDFWKGNGNVKTVIIPEGVIEIESFAFVNCHKLEEVSMPDSVQIIHDDAFKWCENLHNILLSKNLKKIGNRAFEGCKKIEEICIPEGTKKVGVRAFYFCTGLKEAIFSKSIEIIGGSAFEGCYNLSKVEIPPVDYFLQIYSKAFWNCEKLKMITLPMPVDCKIANDAFYYSTEVSYREQ